MDVPGPVPPATAGGAALPKLLSLLLTLHRVSLHVKNVLAGEPQ